MSCLRLQLVWLFALFFFFFFRRVVYVCRVLWMLRMLRVCMCPRRKCICICVCSCRSRPSSMRCGRGVRLDLPAPAVQSGGRGGYPGDISGGKDASRSHHSLFRGFTLRHVVGGIEFSLSRSVGSAGCRRQSLNGWLFARGLLPAEGDGFVRGEDDGERVRCERRDVKGRRGTLGT